LEVSVAKLLQWKLFTILKDLNGSKPKSVYCIDTITIKTHVLKHALTIKTHVLKHALTIKTHVLKHALTIKTHVLEYGKQAGGEIRWDHKKTLFN
jgi:hypothetical protein